MLKGKFWKKKYFMILDLILETNSIVFECILFKLKFKLNFERLNSYSVVGFRLLFKIVLNTNNI